MRRRYGDAMYAKILRVAGGTEIPMLILSLPPPPPRWWELVSRIGDRVVVALVPQETPFDEDGLKAMHSRLLDSPDTALAIVPVVHR